jgi:hypothetical protein
MTTLMQELLDDKSTKYCYYCLEPKGDKYHCCQENHFGTFADLDKEDQLLILEEELGK